MRKFVGTFYLGLVHIWFLEIRYVKGSAKAKAPQELELQLRWSFCSAQLSPSLAIACPTGQDANQQKVDIGPCPKVHSDTILKQFKEALDQIPRDPRIGIYKQEHENHIYGFVDDCDRRIKMAQRKLEKTPEENRKTVDLVSGYLDGVKTVVLSGFL
jgi:hypothetical protein